VDRACGTRPRHPRPGAHVLKPWLAALLLFTAACGNILADLDRVVAIDILGPLNRTVEEGDTLQLSARGIDARGQVVSDVEIVWQAIDTGSVGFSLDPATGVVTGTGAGTGRVQARIEALRAGPVVITGLPAADSLFAASDTLIVIDSAQTGSPPLAVQAVDFTSTPTDTLALAGQDVHFRTVNPEPGTPEAAGFFLAQSETSPGDDPHFYVATTGTDGKASVVVRRAGETQPDSAVIHAVLVTAIGDTVPGSPVRFLIRF
jgi:hypothetical protein